MTDTSLLDLMAAHRKAVASLKAKERELAMQWVRIEIEAAKLHPKTYRPCTPAQSLAQHRNWGIRTCRGMASQLHVLKRLALEVHSVEAENLINSIEFMLHSLEYRLTERCDYRLRKLKVRKSLSEQMRILDQEKAEELK